MTLKIGLTQIIDTAPAATDRSGDVLDPGLGNNLSIQADWLGVVGTGGTLSVEVSLNGLKWVAKKDSSGNPVKITFTVGDGTDIISFNGVVSEQFYRLVYDNGSASAGTFSAWAFVKLVRG